MIMSSTTTQRRRRRLPPAIESNDYYDDDDNKDEEKMYNSACALGQFLLNPCVCLYHYVFEKKKETNKFPLLVRLRQTGYRQSIPVGCSLLLLLLSFCRRNSSYSSSLRVPFEYPLTIPILDLSLSSDKGGWQFYNKFAVPTSPVDAGNPNRLLDFYLSPQTTDEKLAERNWNQHAHSKHHFNSKFLNDEDIADEPDRSCTRQNWALEYHPTCNLLHDLNLLSQDYPSRDNRLDTFYTSHGYFRDVWVLDDEKEKSILKLSRWKHDFKPTLYVGILRDALIMERLTVSPRIVDIYGHCGTAIRVEAIPFEMENVIVPGEGYISSEEEEEEKMKPDVTSKNKFTPTEKLEIALSMAKSIADLHGFSDGLIIHDDVQLCQWLKKKDGAVVLGDFNRAEIPEFNQEKGKYCKYRNGQGFGSYRSPEEFANRPLDEKIDVWSFGNNIYGLLTGLWVFYQNDDDGVVHKKLIDGKLPNFDRRYATRSYAEQVLVKVLKKCWKYNPKKRIDIFSVVDILSKAVDENRRLKGPGTAEAPALEEEEEEGGNDDDDEEGSDSDEVDKESDSDEDGE